mgnify:CR=1 FL=1
MTDVHSPAVRSYNMSQIKSGNTKPELLVRKFLFANGFRYRIHDSRFPGKPDVVLPMYKTVIFVHGCFWHGHDGCKYYIVPKTRTEWWINKIETNRKNDFKALKLLKAAKWKVITVFECELKNEKVEKTLDKLLRTLNKS